MNGVVLSLGGLAVLAALGLSSWNFIRSHKQMDDASFRNEAAFVMESYKTRLRNPEDCTAILGGMSLEEGKSADLVFPQIDESADALRPVELQLETDATEDFRTEILEESGVAAELRRYPAKLKATFQDKSAFVQLDAPFFVWSTPPPPVGSGQIQSCFGSASAGFLCNELGGYFIPFTDPYDQSCRQSVKTLKRDGGKLIPLPNCRVGNLAADAKSCPKYGVKFGAAQLNGRADIAANPGETFFCQVCQ